MKKLMIFFLAVLLYACNGSVDQFDKEKELKAENAFSEESNFQVRMKAIDTDDSLVVYHSLKYNTNDGSTAEAKAFLNKKNQEVKFEETFNDMVSGNHGARYFYLENGMLFASREVKFEKKQNAFVETVSYYKNGNPIYSKERKAAYEEELETQGFLNRKPISCSMDKVSRILNQEKEFATTFQGFAENGNMKFLLVGENKENGFASSLSVQFEDATINKLFKEEEKYIGTPLEVQHELMVDETGMMFQVLLSLKMKKS